MTTMYVADINSTPTELIVGASATDTSIFVLNISVLPSAENILVLGYDTDNPETVLLKSTAPNTLVVERGFQGTAQVWGVGTLVARVFTAYDHDTFIENIDRITPSQNPSFTYVDGLLSRIDYPNGDSKVLTYLNGLLSRVDYTKGTVTYRSDFIYTDGLLSSISESEV